MVSEDEVRFKDLIESINWHPVCQELVRSGLLEHNNSVDERLIQDISDWAEEPVNGIRFAIVDDLSVRQFKETKT